MPSQYPFDWIPVFSWLRKTGLVGLTLLALQERARHRAQSVAGRFRDRLRGRPGSGLRWYVEPLLKGQYPADVLTDLGADAPKVLPGDMQKISVSLDFLGINYYMRSVVGAGQPWDVKSSGHEITDMGWEVYPQGLTELLVRLHRDYPLPPIYITENGAAFRDEVVDGQVHDGQRQRYIANHIAAMHDAMRQGVRVDYDTQQRTLKDSALWYRAFLATQEELT